MRLTPDEAAAIGRAAREAFGPDAIVRLFGSRLDDARRGGDIDLHVQVPAAVSIGERASFRRSLDRDVGALESSDVRHPFAAVFDRLDGFEVLSDVPWWIALGELRNRLIHEYAMTIEERAKEIGAAWTAAGRLRSELFRLREDRDLARKVFPHD